MKLITFIRLSQKIETRKSAVFEKMENIMQSFAYHLMRFMILKIVYWINMGQK